MNKLRVLNLVRKSKDTARSLIGEQTNLSPAAISNIVNYLIAVGLVVESGVENVERTGRKSILLRFNSEGYRLITVSHTAQMLHIYLTDLQGEIYAHTEHRITNSSKENIATLLCSAISEMFRSPEGKKVIAVGLSVSAMVLGHGNRVVSSLMEWDIPTILEQLSAITEAPVIISNNTFAKAMWLCRSLKDWDSGLTLFVDISNGLGLAVIHNGVRLPAVIGEIGHTTVERDGDRCNCGNRGCLEVMCSPTRMLKKYAVQGKSRAENMKDFASLLKLGDPDAGVILLECSEYLGIGLANVISLFNPDRLLINSADFADCPAVVDQAFRVMERRSLCGLATDMEVDVTCFNEQDLPKAMACELCDTIFAQQFSVDILEKMERMSDYRQDWDEAP